MGALVVGAVAGGLYLLPHLGNPFKAPWAPHTDTVAVAVTGGVAAWLLLALGIARRRDAVRSRVAPGLVLAVAAAVALAGAAGADDWPVTWADAATVFVVGLLGSTGVLGVPGSLRNDPWRPGDRP
ncbi:hypothetical protein [Patulibacter sp. SYSU D01012]|uniref:hypothetical protein n=1 Tax=Patulibacter sp. SYSU D01012 TaxID=2817381 RepID=UPI001B30C011|nr:hypothetical protein [Patulibacter sp. SYSU D01012]